MSPRVITVAVGAGLLVIAAVAAASVVLDVPPQTFTRDPAALAPGLPFYGGSVSLLSAVVWGAVASLAAFVAWAGGARLRRPLLLLAALAALLLADDALMLHETLGPRVGIPDEAWYLLYATVAAVLAWSVRGDLRTGHGAAFVLGGAFLAVSVGVDALNTETAVAFLVEDGTKLLGALVWATVPVLAWTSARGLLAAAEQILDVAAGQEAGECPPPSDQALVVR